MKCQILQLKCETPQTAGKQECHFIKGTDGWIAGPAAAMEAEVLWKENNQLHSVSVLLAFVFLDPGT